ncbi:MAG: DUF1580 domain-containing protein [Dehalococcoidia bacterium]
MALVASILGQVPGSSLRQEARRESLEAGAGRWCRSPAIRRGREALPRFLLRGRDDRHPDRAGPARFRGCNVRRSAEGKKVPTSTLYRWVKVGRKGCRLEGISVGGTICTSVEALQRFFEELTWMELPEVTRMVTAARRRQMDEVERSLNELMGPMNGPRVPTD